LRSDWSSITEKDVVEAIKIFDLGYEEFPPARNTFLVFKGKLYPAKHIRSMAYRVAHGSEISKSEFSGGKETVDFFHRLGFLTKYSPSGKKKMIAKIVGILDEPRVKTNESAVNKQEHGKVRPSNLVKKESSISIPGTGVLEQKNALQLVLNRCFGGDIVSEKTFDWLVTPSQSTKYK